MALFGLNKADADPRYAPGGELYAKIASEHGQSGADKVYRASLSGENNAVSLALAELKHGKQLNESTASAFIDRIKTDPFEAPLAGANKAIGNVVNSAAFGLLKNPYVLGVLLLALGLYFWPVVGPLVGRLTASRR